MPNEARLRKLVITKINKQSVDESTNAKESPDFLVFHVLTFEFCVIFLRIQMTEERHYLIDKGKIHCIPTEIMNGLFVTRMHRV